MNLWKRSMALFLTIAIAFSLVSCSGNNGDLTATEIAAQSAAKWVEKDAGKLEYGDEWAIIALARGGYESVFSAKMENYQSSLEKLLRKSMGELVVDEQVQSAGYPRVVLALTALGKYADRSIGYDLLTGISWNTLLEEQGVYGPMYALIAADSVNYEFHENGNVTRGDLVKRVLSWQHEDGGFGWEAAQGESDVDTTAIAIQALSKEMQDASVEKAVNDAVDYLKTQQLENGGFASFGEESCESTCQVAIALTEIGIDPSTFQNKNMMSAIMAFQNENGSFSSKKGEAANSVTSQQALLALVAYNRYVNNETSLFEMSDVYGSSHNKLNPTFNLGLKLSGIFLAILVVFVIILYFRARARIARWRAEGILDEETRTKMSPEQVEAKRMAEQLNLLRAQEDEIDEDGSIEE